MEGLPEGIDSKFRYVLLVSKRAEQLIQGAAPKSRSAALRTVVVELKTEVERIREQVQNVE